MLKAKVPGIAEPRLTIALITSTVAFAAANIAGPGQEVAKELREGKGGSSSGSGALGSPTGTANNTFMAKKGGSGGASGSGGGKEKVTINATFIRHFLKLLKIACPSLRSKDGAYLFSLSALLLLRTGLTLKISACTGLLAKTMVEAERGPFFAAILKLALWSLPAALVNSGLKYLTGLLQLSFRRSLTQHFHQRYLSHRVFFRCVGLGAVDTVEQRVTQDVQRFADEAADMYTTLFKPLIDIVLFSRKVAEHGGYKGPMWIIGYYSAIIVIIRLLAPNFGQLTAQQAAKESDLRTGHSRLIAFNEELTLAGGEATMRRLLDNSFLRALRHALYTALARGQNMILDGMLVKYGSVMVGYGVCALSIFSKEASQKSAADLTGLYVHTSQLLVNLARAVGQFVMTYKHLSQLSGHTHRVYQLEDGLNQVERAIKADKGTTAGEVVIGGGIRFRDVPIVSPDNTTLVKALNFDVQPGMNLLIVGPNGCGKSSTFRLLGELWPCHAGTIEKPSYEQLYYVPQRPYMSSGTLRDQVIYPMKAKDLKVGESELYQCIEKACLTSIFDRPQVSWDARLQWAGEALSHGEKQKLAMARLFFHCPRFAILDECSSAVDVDVEQKLYDECRALGITLITIAHRRSVWKHHNWVLRFDGNGGYMFSPLAFDANGDIVLTCVKQASDPAMIGRTVSVGASSVTVDGAAVEPQDLPLAATLAAAEAQRRLAADASAPNSNGELTATSDPVTPALSLGAGPIGLATSMTPPTPLTPVSAVTTPPPRSPTIHSSSFNASLVLSPQTVQPRVPFNTPQHASMSPVMSASMSPVAVAALSPPSPASASSRDAAALPPPALLPAASEEAGEPQPQPQPAATAAPTAALPSLSDAVESQQRGGSRKGKGRRY